MATHTTITPPVAVEAQIRMSCAFTLRFGDLLNYLASHIHAERDLDRTSLADPAYQRRLDRADAASLRLYDVLAQLTAMPASDATTAPLRRMALIVATLVREGTATAFFRYADSRDDFAEFLAIPGDGPIEARIRHLLAAADKRIAAMAGLSCYIQDGAALDAEPDLIAA